MKNWWKRWWHYVIATCVVAVVAALVWYQGGIVAGTQAIFVNVITFTRNGLYTTVAVLATFFVIVAIVSVFILAQSLFPRLRRNAQPNPQPQNQQPADLWINTKAKKVFVEGKVSAADFVFVACLLTAIPYILLYYFEEPKWFGNLPLWRWELITVAAIVTTSLLVATLVYTKNVFRALVIAVFVGCAGWALWENTDVRMWWNDIPKIKKSVAICIGILIFLVIWRLATDADFSKELSGRIIKGITGAFIVALVVWSFCFAIALAYYGTGYLLDTGVATPTPAVENATPTSMAVPTTGGLRSAATQEVLDDGTVLPLGAVKRDIVIPPGGWGYIRRAEGVPPHAQVTINLPSYRLLGDRKLKTRVLQRDGNYFPDATGAESFWKDGKKVYTTAFVNGEAADWQEYQFSVEPPLTEPLTVSFIFLQ